MVATSIVLRWAAARHTARSFDTAVGDAPGARQSPGGAASKPDEPPVDVSALSSDEDGANSVGEDASDHAARAVAGAPE